MNGRILRDFIIVLPRLQFRGRRAPPHPSLPHLPPSHIPSNRVIKAFRARPASQVGFMLPFRTLEFSNLTAGLGERFKYFSWPYLPVWAAGGAAKRSIWRYIWGLTFDRFIGSRREGRGCLSPCHCFPGMTYYLYAPFRPPPRPSLGEVRS